MLFAEKITIAVAANVSYAIDELKQEFSKVHPETEVRIVFGSSGKLTSQIRNGAPYGLFMSANMRYPEALLKDKIAITEPVVYAHGGIAYLSVKERDFSRGMQLLQYKDIRTIAIANPKTAPYGSAAEEAMKAAGLYKSLRSKLIYAESISQAVSYTLNAAEVGIVAKSSLYSPKMQGYKENKNWKAVDPNLYTPIQQGVVLLRHSKTSEGYRAFYDFILSERAKTIFKKYGYII
jgi:molybdate transport system substrate-binding protein